LKVRLLVADSISSIKLTYLSFKRMLEMEYAHY
jgi:hypothetical protein